MRFPRAREWLDSTTPTRLSLSRRRGRLRVFPWFAARGGTPPRSPRSSGPSSPGTRASWPRGRRIPASRAGRAGNGDGSGGQTAKPVERDDGVDGVGRDETVRCRHRSSRRDGRRRHERTCGCCRNATAFWTMSSRMVSGASGSAPVRSSASSLMARDAMPVVRSRRAGVKPSCASSNGQL